MCIRGDTSIESNFCVCAIKHYEHCINVVIYYSNMVADMAITLLTYSAYTVS